MRLDEAQQTATSHITRTIGPLSRLLILLFTAASCLTAPAAAPAQQPARAGAPAPLAAKALAGEGDAILDNITLYWLTNTGASAARLYWEEARFAFKGDVPVRAAFTVFPGESFRAPRTWVERTFNNLIYFNEVDKGGHFAAWEQPELLAQEVRAAFKSLR
jgi:pimeloyl-ACP methyl ester carboxylesterase